MTGEAISLLASILSTLSRAGLNVVDRKQFRSERVCPLVIGYWNNLLPIFLVLPLVFIAPKNIYVLRDIFSFEIIFFSILIQCVAYSFSFSFKALRVADIGILAKVADITVPLVIAALGLYLTSFSFALILPVLLLMFIFSAGLDVVKKVYKSSIVLVLALTAQGVYSYFWGFDLYLNRDFWGLISIAFSILVWRFVFSGVLLLYRNRISYIYFYPKEFLSKSGFYLRGFLTILTQLTFIQAITTNNLIIVWPILNATGLIGAFLAYIFLGEKLFPRDLLFAISAIFLGALVSLILHYENI